MIEQKIEDIRGNGHGEAINSYVRWKRSKGIHITRGDVEKVAELRREIKRIDGLKGTSRALAWPEKKRAELELRLLMEKVTPYKK